MRWIPLILIFLLAYIEIFIFMQVAHVLGIAVTLLLVVFTSCLGVSLVRNQGIRTFIQMQRKIEAGESPAAEMVKSVSLVMSGFLLLVPGFFTDFLGLLLLLPALQKHLTLKLMPHLHLRRSRSGPAGSQGDVFEGEYQRKDQRPERLEKHDENDDR